MCKPKKEYTEEELKERKRLANKKYRESLKGKMAQKRATYKYQQKECFKEYRKKYVENLKRERTFILKKSTRENKKYMVINGNGKKIHFGGKGNKDYIIYNKKDKDLAIEKKKAYIKRHEKLKEDWNNINTAGFWAKNILWNKSTMERSINDTKRKYKIKIISELN